MLVIEIIISSCLCVGFTEYKNSIIFYIGFLSREIHIIMYVRIKYSFSSGVGYVRRPILLIMWTAFQSFILRGNNNSNNSNLFSQSTLYNLFRLKHPLFRLKNSFR